MLGMLEPPAYQPLTRRLAPHEALGSRHGDEEEQ